MRHYIDQTMSQHQAKTADLASVDDLSTWHQFRFIQDQQHETRKRHLTKQMSIFNQALKEEISAIVSEHLQANAKRELVILEIDDVATILKVPKKWIYIHAIELPFAFKLPGGQWRFVKAGLEDFINNKTRPLWSEADLKKMNEELSKKGVRDGNEGRNSKTP